MTSIVGGVSAPALGPQGFVQMRQSDWTAYLNSELVALLGSSANLDPRSNLGQLVNIMAERFALLSEMGETIAQQTTVAGAQGVNVDNILALSGLTRLAATPTVTAPTPIVQGNGVTFYGLALLGTPGTVVPAGTLVADGATPPHTLSLNAAVTIAPAANAVQTLTLSNVPTTGTLALSLTDAAGNTLTTGSIAAGAPAQTTLLSWASVPTSGTYTLSIGASSTPALAYNTAASGVAAALSTLTSTTVSVAGTQASGMTVTWPAGAVPLLSASSDASAPTIVSPVQAAINALQDSATSQLPFTDLAVTGGGSSYTLSFGANTPSSGQPSSGAQAVPLVTVASTSLQAGSTVTNVTVANAQQGAPAQGIGAATSTVAGSIAIPAGAITTLATPVAGCTGARNDLDCVSGTDVETDTQALARRGSLLAARSQGPLAAVVQQVSDVAGVTTALAFTNTTNAAQQVVTFATAPSSGTFQLFLGTSSTASMPYSVTAAQMQAAIQALAAFPQASVSGSGAYGFTVDFGGAQGGQAIPLMVVANNTTGVGIKIAFGRPPHSVEMVVAGGDNTAVAQAIYDAAPSGIATYGAPVLTTTASVAAGSATMTVSSAANLTVGLAAQAMGVPPGTLITSLSGNSVSLSATAIASYSNTPVSFGYQALLADSNANPVLIAFSRPQLLPVYVVLNLLTDAYAVPGNSASGRNPSARFSPASISTIVAAIVAGIQQVPIGGTLVGLGTNGLLTSFATVPGIVSFTMTFGLTPAPSAASNITMLPEQAPLGAAQYVTVSYT